MRIIGVVLAVIFGVVTFSAPLIAQQKTEKACQEEWRANKAANQAKGITEQAYVAKCRMGSSMAPAPTASTSSRATAGGAAATAGAEQAKTEAEEKARCGWGTVVWPDLG